MTQWIKKEDGLPKKEGDYLVWIKVREFGETYRFRTWLLHWIGHMFVQYEFALDINMQSLTHWMPLPEKPNDLV